MKVLVTGSTGKVGSVVVETLARLGVQVLAASRTPENVVARAGVTAVHFDYADAGTHDAALAGVDRVFLMEPQPSVGPADATMIPFAERALAQGCKVVLLSSASVAFQQEPLGEVEEVVRRSEESVILRSNWFLDNFHTWWAEGIQQGRVLALPAGEGRTPFVDARDVGAAAAAALVSEAANGRTLMLTGPASRTHAEVARVLGEAARAEIRYEDVPEEVFAEMLTQAGLPAEAAVYIGSLFRLTRLGVFAEPTGDLEWLTKQRGRTLEQYAADYREAWQ